MRRLAFLTPAALLIAGMTVGCGNGTNPLSTGTSPRTVSLSIRDNPPAGVTVLSFEADVKTATLQPSDSSKPAVSLISSPVQVEFTKLETEKAFLSASNAPSDTYSSMSLTFANPELTILNETGKPLTIGSQICLNGMICEFTPSLSQSTITVNSKPFPVTVSQNSPIGLVVDFDLNTSIQNNLSITPSVTVAAVPGKPSNGELEDIEGVTGRVLSLSNSSFTLQDATSGQTFTVAVDGNTKYENFKEIGCATSNFSCMTVGQIIEVEHLLVMDKGTLLASEIQLDDAVNEQQLEGTIVAVDSINNKFQMVVKDEEPTIKGVNVGNAVKITVNAGAQFTIGNNNVSVVPSGSSFASMNDLVVGQEVKVRALVVSSQTTGISVSTDHVKLHSSQFAGTVANINNFTVNNLSSLFTSVGINQIQVRTSSSTEFEGVSGASALANGNNVVLRGLLFKTTGDPVLVAKKVRKP